MRGRLTLELRDAGGRVRARRRGTNAVMRGGAELVARLFAGGGTGITHVGVGASDAPESDAYATAELTADVGDGAPLEGALQVAIPSEAFGTEVDEARRLVWVRLQSTVPQGAAVGTIREAGLLSVAGDESRLYNRITFAPVVKRAEDEITLFWEVSFPYGDLHWLG